MANNHVLDFIKLDIEGAEKELMDEEASRTVMCQARCIFMELHERYAPGTEACMRAFVEHGCAHLHGPAAQGFQQLVQTGEYVVICRRDLIAQLT